MNDDRAAWPSLDSLEHGTSLTRKPVIEALNELDWTGFITRRRGQHCNTYFPQLTPDIERLAHDFLEDSRRRNGQLPLPLDGRGLSLVHPRVELLHSQSGDSPSQSGVTPPEVVREVVSEVGTGLVRNSKTSENLGDPLTALVADLADADEATLHVFQLQFRHLSGWAIEKAHDELRLRRKNTKRPPLRSEASYVCEALRRQRTERRDRARTGSASEL